MGLLSLTMVTAQIVTLTTKFTITLHLIKMLLKIMGILMSTSEFMGT